MAVEQPFRYSVRQTSPTVVDVEYAGHMPEDDTHIRKTEAMVRSAPGRVGLCYSVAGFTAFHRSQVKGHADLLVRLGSKVSGVAAVGARPVIRFAATTVGLISKTPLKTFDTRAEALTWLASL